MNWEKLSRTGVLGWLCGNVRWLTAGTCEGTEHGCAGQEWEEQHRSDNEAESSPCVPPSHVHITTTTD